VREVSYSGKFRRDLKLIQKRGKDIEKLKQVIALLVNDSQLPVALCDHALKGSWKPRRDLHIEPDWILIYIIDDHYVHLDRTGSHSDIFR